VLKLEITTLKRMDIPLTGLKDYETKPFRIKAMRWMGGNTDDLYKTLGWNWGRADVQLIPWEHPDEDEIVIYNSLEGIWIPLPVGHWVIMGAKGEFYPCDDEIFRMKYQEVEE
jgi:hypothetical protein